jgi:hypothetical protein
VITASQGIMRDESIWYSILWFLSREKTNKLVILYTWLQSSLPGLANFLYFPAHQCLFA